MKLTKKLKNLGKLYYTTGDLRKVIDSTDGTLYVTLSRLVKQGELIRLASGIYILPERYGEIEKIANSHYIPSYLSFETALSKYGIISQIPYLLSYATSRKTRKLMLGEYPVEYRQLRGEVYFGFEQREDGVFIATPEKALFDILYLTAYGKLIFDFSSIDLKSLDIKIILRYTDMYIKRFAPRIKRLVYELIH
jgi:predicted transcriptional regulator of viral defense system